MHDGLLWVKGPSPNSQIRNEWISFSFVCFCFEICKLERDRSYCMWKVCVKVWSQSRCVFLFTCRLIGVERVGQPDKLVFTCLGERGPACLRPNTHCHGLGVSGVCCATGFAFLRAISLEDKDSPSSSSSASCSSAGERVRWRPPARCLAPWWAWWESGDCVTMRERCRAVV